MVSGKAGGLADCRWAEAAAGEVVNLQNLRQRLHTNIEAKEMNVSEAAWMG